MSTSHTPGPWLMQPTAGDHDFIIYAEAGGRDVALVRDFNEPNARLIVAAPELKDSVQEILDNLDQIQPSHLRTLGLEPAIEKLRAALEKAGVS